MLGVGPALAGAGERDARAENAQEVDARFEPATTRRRGAERDAWAILAAVVGLGPVGFAALLAQYGTATAIVADAARPGAAVRFLAVPPPGIARSRDGGRQERHPITADVAEAIVTGVQRGPLVLARLRELGIDVVTLDEGAYPGPLARIALPPHVLYVTGRPDALTEQRSVAIVGTRHATGGGRQVAGRIARALVDTGTTVVSGLAYGIDGAAHEATIRAGGTTVAVIGGGHAYVGPPAHLRLADAILANGGAIISEHAPDVAPSRGTFPRRNRIISGLSKATIVVEAPARSGALITASWAMEQGRECFVVPGAIDAPASAGCLSLLREFPEQVRIVAGIPQLIADLGFAADGRTNGRRVPAASSEAVAAASLGSLGRTERAVADGLLAGLRTVDELVASLDLPVATVLATIALLERRGLVLGAHGRYRPDGPLLGTPPLPKTR